MNYKHKFFYTFLILAIFSSCKKYNDSTYFYGNIQHINNKTKKVKNVELTSVLPLDGANFGQIAVHDSLMLFWNPKLQNRFFNIFNLDTGKEIGTFCNKGQGPDEIVALSPIYQLFSEGNDVKTILIAPNESKILKWNITQSINQKTTVIDSIIPYSRNKENIWVSYDFIFRQSEDLLFTHMPSFELNEEEGSLPFYQERTFFTDSTLRDYQIYKKTIKNSEASIIPEAFFKAVTAIKPDGSKIVEFMIRIWQINILDTETGEIIGYRMEGSPDFSIFQKKKINFNINYTRVQADNQFIYASYWGKEDWGIKELPFINTIHVFDWNGNWLYELKTDQPVHEMWLDRVRNRLYTTNLNIDDVFYLDLNELN